VARSGLDAPLAIHLNALAAIGAFALRLVQRAGPKGHKPAPAVGLRIGWPDADRDGRLGRWLRPPDPAVHRQRDAMLGLAAVLMAGAFTSRPGRNALVVFGG